MNILLFTSSMIDNDFSTWQTNAKIKPNPSNQNFYSNLIKSLSINNNVHVVSHRPFKKGMFYDKTIPGEDAIHSGRAVYFYTRLETGKIYKLLREVNDIMTTAKHAIEFFHSNDFIIVTDTLRYNLLKAAIQISKEYNVKIVGMLTDNPDNLSFKNVKFAKKIKSLASNLDGYLALSHGLVDAYNSEKPSYIFEGLVNEEKYFKKDPIYDYYFFAGSLYERYGVKALIDAFHMSNIKSKLVIAGSGPLSKYIDQISKEDYRILYLSQLPKNRILGYEANAIANINPRPLNAKLDKESVPSKLLEYLSIGTPIISTKFEKLYGPFKDDVCWIEDESVFGIKNTLEDFDTCDKEKAKKKASNAKLKVFEFYGLKVQSESINHFLASINSSNNN